MLKNEVTEEVIKEIENSPYWKQLNENCKAIYEAHSRVPSEEEYKALRNILICKVILEDPNVNEKMKEKVWQALK